MSKRIIVNSIEDIKQLVREEILIEVIERDYGVVNAKFAYMYQTGEQILMGKVVMLGKKPHTPEIKKNTSNPVNNEEVEAAEKKDSCELVAKKEDILVNDIIMFENNNPISITILNNNNSSNKYLIINYKDVVLVRN